MNKTSLYKEKIEDSRLTSDMQRSRHGCTQLFRKDYGDREFTTKENADVILEHHLPECYAELLLGEWYWVKGCSKCEDSMNYGENYSYQVCYEHNRCVDCGVHRESLTHIPFRVRNGFRCKECQDKLDKSTLENALEKRKTMSDCDFQNTYSVICPYCGSDNGTDDFHNDSQYECIVCKQEFALELEYSVTYTTRILK
ncbi:MAG: hypothetical protein RBR50_01135 [Candidatus Izemoplasmatales bacterium]|nr:hypothetical protein [Candidatus Izemoplasmatales bacterium]